MKIRIEGTEAEIRDFIANIRLQGQVGGLRVTKFSDFYPNRRERTGRITDRQKSPVGRVYFDAFPRDIEDDEDDE